MPSSPDDAAAIANAARTYLGRLVSVSRGIRLGGRKGTMLLVNGVEYPSWPEAREASASILTRESKGKPGRFVLRASLERALWRELSAITVKTLDATSNGGPLALNHLSREEAFDLWVGGLVASEAKVLDVVEAVFHVPAAMLQTTGQQCYEKGVKFAEDAAGNLGQAVAAYHRALGDSLDRGEARGRRDALRSKAAFQFWTQAERDVPLLLAAVASENRPADAASWAQSDWGRAIHSFAREAYELACPRQTARQMQAFVSGLAVLFPARDNEATVEKS
jgi:CRISPR system Cascade subunit CasA